MKIKAWGKHFNDAGGENADFQVADRIENEAGPNYFGFVTLPDRKGNIWWFIMKEVVTGDEISTRYTKVVSTDYPTAWAGRAALTYYYFYEL